MKKTALALIALTSLALAGCGWEGGDSASTPGDIKVGSSALDDVPSASATPTTASSTSTPAATASSTHGATATPSASSNS